MASGNLRPLSAAGGSTTARPPSPFDDGDQWQGGAQHRGRGKRRVASVETMAGRGDARRDAQQVLLLGSPHDGGGAAAPPNGPPHARSLSALRHTRPSDPLEVSPPPSPREGIASGCGGCASWRACVLHEPLLFFTLLGVLAGVALGVALKPAQLEAEAVELIGFPGELMLRLLKMLALPLISISMIAGVVGLRPSDPAGGGGVRRLAWLTAAFYIGSTLLAILVGILLVVALHPGRGAPFDAIAAAGGKGGCHAAQAKKVAQHASAQAEQRMSTTDALLSVARQVVPDNIAGAAVQMNVLGLITFSLMLGLALASLGPSADGVIKAVGVLNAAVQRMVTWALWLSPLGIGSLIAASILRACDLLGTLAALGLWVATVLAGLAIFAGLLLPALLWASTGRHPLATARAFASSLLMAFGSSSSAAALPQAMQSARDLGCDDSTVAFFLPLGTTVNMNGTALYEATTAIFIAQAHGVSLNAAQLVVVALTASLAAVGAPAIPSAGLVTMLIVLQAVGLEQYAGDLAVILAIDWLLDRVRTCVNLLGDAYGCVIVDDLMKRHSGSGSGRLAGSAGKQIPYIALEMGEGPGQAGQRGAAAAAAAGAAAGYGESKTPGAPR